MKKEKFKVLLLVGWMVIIFLFSSQPASVSDENNKFVVYLFNLLGLDLNSTFGALTDFIIRKAAHLSEYFILYCLLLNVIKDKKGFSKPLVYSFGGVFIYACTDEFHQLFIQGRSGKFGDVLIDTMGGLIALLFNYIYCHLQKKPRK